LIGANGAGKTNFLSFFNLLQAVVAKQLGYYVGKHRGANEILHLGSKVTKQIFAKITISQENKPDQYYTFVLEVAQGNELFFAHEYAAIWDAKNYNSPRGKDLGAGHKESRLNTDIDFTHFVKENISKIYRYHFHDTSFNAPLRLPSNIQDFKQLKANGDNLPSVLLNIKNRNIEIFRRIENIVQRIAPYFHEFTLDKNAHNENEVILSWRGKGTDKYFDAQHLSDGTLRMIALTTVLLQPNKPSLIIIDEPEIGLHPAAISVLVELIRQASKSTQILLATQSPTFLDYFEPEEIIVAENKSNKTEFKRLNPSDLSKWKEDYSLGELWEKNLLGGRP
jgi:predicted ATPase